MPKFTEPPWEWVNPYTDEPVKLSQGLGYFGRLSLRTVNEYTRAVFTLPQFIIDVEEFGASNSMETNQANGRLIQKSPEMYNFIKIVAKEDSFLGAMAKKMIEYLDLE